MASSAVPMVVAANMKAAKGGDTQPVVKVCEGWFQKKGGKEGKARARKRWFVLFSDGLIRYYAAVSPDGKPTGEKVRKSSGQCLTALNTVNTPMMTLPHACIHACT